MYPETSDVLPYGSVVSYLGNRRLVCGTGTADRSILKTGDHAWLVSYCTDGLRDRGYYHCNSFIPEKTA